MKSSNYAPILLLVAAISLGACDTASRFSGTGGGGGGGLAGGGGGGGGGPTVGVEPIMQYDSLFDPLPIVEARISGDASVIVWVDRTDPFGNNPNGRAHLFSKSLSTGTISQLTAGDENFSYDLADWDITDDGDFVVFVSRLDWAGTNPSGDENVFLVSTTGGGFTQVTDISSGDVARVSEPQIANNGVIVFATSEDLTGDNTSTGGQIFRINSDGTGLAQVTSLRLDVFDLALADSGNRVAFGSFRDPFGTNVPSSDEIFVIDIDGMNLTQLTETAGNSYEPRISDDGNRVAFAQDGEIWVHTIDAATTVQITDDDTWPSGRYPQTTTYGSFDLSGNGLTVVFSSQANHTGDNPNGDHTIFAAPTSGQGPIIQVLRDGQVAASAPDFDGQAPWVINDGAGLVFRSETNLTSFDQEITEFIYTTVIQ